MEWIFPLFTRISIHTGIPPTQIKWLNPESQKLNFPHVHVHSLCRDAQEAARRRDGYEFGGSRLRVEVAKGGNETQSAPRAAYRAPRGAAGYRILIKGLPKSASWQDLKVGHEAVQAFTLCVIS